MATQFRILLKAIAVIRYIGKKERFVKLVETAKGVIKGTNSFAELVKAAIPSNPTPMKERIQSKCNWKHGKWYLIAGVTFGLASYLYYNNRNYVPITHRRHFAVLSRHYELRFQAQLLNKINNQFVTTKDNTTQSLVLSEDDPRVQEIKRILGKLQEACIYFSPECDTYMHRMKLVVVENPEVNAYTMMGSIIVVFTGLLQHFDTLKEEGMIQNEEECIAGVLAHELSHSLSRHCIESMLRWTSLAYHLYITMIPDLIVMPMIKGIYDKMQGREFEHEADLQALYLLKRSGYDPTSMLTTLSLLPEEKDDEDIEILSKTKEMILDHPRICSRVAYLQDHMFSFQKDFKLHYKTLTTEPTTESASSWSINDALRTLFTCICLFAILPLLSHPLFAFKLL